MRKISILPLAACLAILLVLPQAASACGSACLYPNGCGTCTFIGEGTGGACIQYDVCVCYDLQCGFAAPPKDGELSKLESLVFGESQETECSAPATPDMVWSL